MITLVFVFIPTTANKVTVSWQKGCWSSGTVSSPEPLQMEDPFSEETEWQNLPVITKKILPSPL